jgi:hypothetical protein
VSGAAATAEYAQPRAARARQARRIALYAIGPALGLGYLLLLIATEPALGMSRDEGIYVDAAQRYAGWLEELVRQPSRALEREAIDSAFRYNREHPPLMKLLFGLGHLAQKKYALFGSDSLSFRFAGMLSAALLIGLIHHFGARLYGRAAGVFAALTYALLPRPFYHAHLNAFDVPITLATCAVGYCYWRSLRDPRWALACGGAFGLALLVKHNSWFLPGIFALHFAVVGAVELRARKRGAAREIALVPYWLFAMLALGPLLFFGGWPWLWHDTWPRLRDYAAFHLHHDYYNIEYFGVNYFWPPFPMSYPWVMTLFTVPLTTLALGLAGAGRELRATYLALRPLVRRQRAAATAPDLGLHSGAGRDEAAAPDPEPALGPIAGRDPGGVIGRDPALATILLLGMLLAPLVIISIPTTPIFGGTKHWFPAYPMLALFAGRGFRALLQVLPLPAARARTLAACAVGLWLLAPAALETAHSHPFALSHYTAAAGGVPGAAEKGMNRQFWGFTTRSLTPYLRETLPNGGNLYLCDTIWTAFEMLIRDGLLPPTFRAVGDIARADYSLVHHEKHFAEVDHQIWTTYQSVRPHHVLTYDGVPIISVYQNPR